MLFGGDNGKRKIHGGFNLFLGDLESCDLS